MQNKYLVTVVQKIQYTETLVAEFSTLDDAGKFVEMIMCHCENVSATISITNEPKEVEE